MDEHQLVPQFICLIKHDVEAHSTSFDAYNDNFYFSLIQQFYYEVARVDLDKVILSHLEVAGQRCSFFQKPIFRV